MEKKLNVPCHIEFNTTDFNKFEEFYKIFGWKVINNSMKNYRLLKFRDNFPVGGAILLVDKIQDRCKSNPLIYIRVDNIDKVLSDLVNQGAEIQQEKISIPQIGEWATFYDIDNNLIGLWKEV